MQAITPSRSVRARCPGCFLPWGQTSCSRTPPAHVFSQLWLLLQLLSRCSVTGTRLEAAQEHQSSPSSIPRMQRLRSHPRGASDSWHNTFHVSLRAEWKSAR